MVLFDAASNGKLTQVAGSPFPTTGLAIGSNGSYFITLGTNLVHSYAVKANGAIGGQVSSINTQNYAGSECGTAYGTGGANIDHTGQDVYVLLNNYGECSSIQTFGIVKGKLGFKGDAVTGATQEADSLPHQ